MWDVTLVQTVTRKEFTVPLPVLGFRFTDMLNGVGGAVVQLNGKDLSERLTRAIVTAVEANALDVMVVISWRTDTERAIMFHGPIVDFEWDDSAQTATVTADSFATFAAARFLAKVHATVDVYTYPGLTVPELAHRLIYRALTQTTEDQIAGVHDPRWAVLDYVVSSAAGPVLPDLATAFPRRERLLSEVLSDLAAMDYGPDVRWHASWTESGLVTMASCAHLLTVHEAELTAPSHPGQKSQLVDLRRRVNAQRRASALIAVGGGQGASMLRTPISYADAGATWDPSHPWLDRKAEARKQIDNLDQLRLVGRGEMRERVTPTAQVTFNVEASGRWTPAYFRPGYVTRLKHPGNAGFPATKPNGDTYRVLSVSGDTGTRLRLEVQRIDG